MTNEDKIKKLHPSIQQKIRDFIALSAKEGEPLLITQGLRTIDEQNALYAQGRTKPGNIVTNAKGGYSWHNFGLAVDVTREDGVYPSASDPFWDRLGKRASKFGLEHGDQGYTDKPHFQYRGGLQLSDARAGKRPGNNNLTEKDMEEIKKLQEEVSKLITFTHDIQKKMTELEKRVEKTETRKLGKKKGFKLFKRK